MFKIGDQIIYSAHGICTIDDICEETVSGVTKNYYKLHPMGDKNRLTISTPVDNDKVVMLALLDKKEALEIMESFKSPGIDWIEDSRARLQKYTGLMNSGDRQGIAKLVNTLIRKKIEAKEQEKKMYEKDHKIFNGAQTILFHELALALATTFEEVNLKATRLVKERTPLPAPVLS